MVADVAELGVMTAVGDTGAVDDSGAVGEAEEEEVLLSLLCCRASIHTRLSEPQATANNVLVDGNLASPEPKRGYFFPSLLSPFLGFFAADEDAIGFSGLRTSANDDRGSE